MIDESEVLNNVDQLRSRYDVLRQLGRDGDCVVYGVRTPGSDRHYAVKVMDDHGSECAEAGVLQVWQAHTMERLEHPNLMVLHAVHHLQGGAVAVAMERRRGRTLAERIDEGGRLPVAEAEQILREIAAALAYLHGRGVVHRGVSVHSIFLDEDTRCARLAPFGVDRAGAELRPDPDTAAPLRSLAYLAPEQLVGRKRVTSPRLSGRSDLYSLALVGYAMLTGRDPSTERNRGGATDVGHTIALPPLPTVRPETPAYLYHAIEGCLGARPRRRWRSAEEFLTQLDPAADGLSSGSGRIRTAIRVRLDEAGSRLGAALHRMPTVRTGSPLGWALSGSLVVLLGLALSPGGSEPPPRHLAEDAAEIPAVERSAPVRSRDLAAENTGRTRLPAALVRPPVPQFDRPPPNSTTASEAAPVAAGTLTPAPVASRPRPSSPAPSARRSDQPAGVVLLGDPIDR